MNGHPAAVLRRAATLAPSVLPAGLAEIAADEIGIELSQLDTGAPVDSIDERILGVAQEILALLPEDYAGRAQRELEAAGWNPLSAEVAADLLHLVDAWSAQGPGDETAVLLAQIRQLVQGAPAADGASAPCDAGLAGDDAGERERQPSCGNGEAERAPADTSFQEALAEDIMIGYDDYLRDKYGRSASQ